MDASGRDRGEVTYGRNPVREAIRAGRRPVHEVLVAGRAAELDWLAESTVVVTRTDPATLDVLAGSSDHQGIVARVGRYPYADAEGLLADPEALVVVLDGVTDPHNLGAIARTAECLGAAGIVLPRHGAAAVTPAVCKASAGAVEHLAIAETRNLADWIIAARAVGAWSWAAAAGGVPPSSADLTGRTVLVVGAEGGGVRPRVRQACDGVVGIPMRGRIDSLNVSVAAGMLLYEAMRQRMARI